MYGQILKTILNDVTKYVLSDTAAVVLSLRTFNKIMCYPAVSVPVGWYQNL